MPDFGSFDPTTAVRTTVQMVFPDITEVLNRKGLPFVFRVTLLTADLPSLFLAFTLGLRRLDDITGRRLGGCLLVLAEPGVLCFQVGNTLFQASNLLLQPQDDCDQLSIRACFKSSRVHHYRASACFPSRI